MSHQTRIACVDVDYRVDVAVAAGLWFCGSSAGAADRQEVAVIDGVAPYQPGEFYRRELPCLLKVLAKGPPAEVILIDGYVWLNDGKPGLGAHLYNAIGNRSAVVGVAKTHFAGASAAIPIRRGSSQVALFITAVGIDVQVAAEQFAKMHGEHRIPTLLKQVDRLARSYRIANLDAGEKEG